MLEFYYQIRYNKNRAYNMPFGKDRSCFNPTLQKQFVAFVNAVTPNFTFSNIDFREIDFSKVTREDLAYCDPPYLVTTASYNESGGWIEQDEYDLLDLLDTLHSNGIRFALSNVLTHKGKRNDILIGWCDKNADKYKVHHLNHTYSNCSYQDKAGNTGVSDEVLIVNYQ